MTYCKLVPVEPTPEMDDLVKRLRIKAGMIELGELIAWGSDSALMREAADALERLAAPDMQGEPVAWMHSDPGRVDVIHDKVRKLLKDSSDNAGYLHRPLDKSERYTIPLYTVPQPAEQQPAPDVSAQDGGVTMFEHLTITENWNGEGLPPIGERVGNNQLNASGFYAPAIIVAHVPYRDQLAAVFVLEDKSDWSWSSFGLDDLGQRAFVPWASVSQSA